MSLHELHGEPNPVCWHSKDPRLSVCICHAQFDRQIEHLGGSAALRENNLFELLHRLVQ